MKKQIAVILGSINLDNQKKILKGLIAAAKETDTNLYVFTNYVGMQESEESFLNSYQINMRLSEKLFSMFWHLPMVQFPRHISSLASFKIVAAVDVIRKSVSMSDS